MPVCCGPQKIFIAQWPANTIKGYHTHMLCFMVDFCCQGVPHHVVVAAARGVALI